MSNQVLWDYNDTEVLVKDPEIDSEHRLAIPSEIVFHMSTLQNKLNTIQCILDDWHSRSGGNQGYMRSTDQLVHQIELALQKE